MTKPRPWLYCSIPAIAVLIFIGCKAVQTNKEMERKLPVVNINPRNAKAAPRDASRDMLLAAAIATNISLAHTTIMLTNIDYYVGLPVRYTNKLGMIFTYTNRVWFWEASTNLKTWTWDGWSTNTSETMLITNTSRFYRGWNVPHGHSLKWFLGTPQPPEL